MSITEIREGAMKRLGRRRAARPAATVIAEIEAAQRYRTMIGIEQSLEERTARARKNAARIEPLAHKTW